MRSRKNFDEDRLDDSIDMLNQNILVMFYL